MAHPQMFDDDDPLLAAVQDRALALPEAAMKVSHGRPAFHTRKVFAYYGGARRVDGEWVQHPWSVLVLPEEAERQALLDDERSFVPAYLGPSGWVGLDLGPREQERPDLAQVDLDEVAELLDASYRLTASATLVRRLDDAVGDGATTASDGSASGR